MSSGHETILSGGQQFPAVWVLCKAAASFKPNEALVWIATKDVKEAEFFVDKSLVRPEKLSKDPVDGQVKVMVLSREDHSVIVEVPGEPISYGPRIRVDEKVLAS